jgi:ABC-type lipoprotein release transport system permease subunit
MVPVVREALRRAEPRVGFDVLSRFDVWTFLSVAMVLAVIAALASYLPVRRATRLDPVVALRSE